MPIAAEAWLRADSGEQADEELYGCDAQWSGRYDRIFPHTSEEIEGAWLWRLITARPRRKKRHLTPALSPTEAERGKQFCALCVLLRRIECVSICVHPRLN